MTIDYSHRGRWLDELRHHEREIERLSAEIAMLDREQRESAGSGVVGGIARLQIEFANAQLTRHRIGAALLSARLRSLA